jgi:hypothetical protein
VSCCATCCVCKCRRLTPSPSRRHAPAGAPVQWPTPQGKRTASSGCGQAQGLKQQKKQVRGERWLTSHCCRVCHQKSFVCGSSFCCCVCPAAMGGNANICHVCTAVAVLVCSCYPCACVPGSAGCACRQPQVVQAGAALLLGHIGRELDRPRWAISPATHCFYYVRMLPGGQV